MGAAVTECVYVQAVAGQIAQQDRPGAGFRCSYHHKNIKGTWWCDKTPIEAARPSHGGSWPKPENRVPRMPQNARIGTQTGRPTGGVVWAGEQPDHGIDLPQAALPPANTQYPYKNSGYFGIIIVDDAVLYSVEGQASRSDMVREICWCASIDGL